MRFFHGALIVVFIIHCTARRLCCCALLGVFMMVAFGIIAGIFIISIEIAYKRHRRLKEKELELAKTAADRWRGNIEVSFVYVTSCHTVWHCHSVNVLSIHHEVSTLSGCLLTLCLFIMKCSHCCAVLCAEASHSETHTAAVPARLSESWRSNDRSRSVKHRQPRGLQ